MKRLPAVLASLACLTSQPSALAADESKDRPSIESVLAKEILGPRKALAEVQAYVESRVPRMPSPASAGEWLASAEKMRVEALEKVVFRGEAAKWRDSKPEVVFLDEIPGGPGYRIKKLRYLALPGFWVPALLYLPDKIEGKVPVVLNVNGHDGDGKAADYKQLRCINLAKRGIIALNTEWLGMGQFRTDENRHPLINHIDLCGTTGVSVHYLIMSRGIDLLLDLPNADPSRVCVTGLSGGGWQTIFVSAFDTRVTLSVPVAGYSSFRTRTRFASDLGDSEQTPVDLGTVTDYAQMTAMRAPRPTLLVFNEKDNCCFATPHALPPLLQAAEPIYKLLGVPQNIRSHSNHDPGTHNYLEDNREALYRALGDYFFPGKADFPRKEIPSKDEVKTKEQLFVELPKDNASLHSLAMNLSASLPRKSDPTELAAKVASVVRADRFDVRAEKLGEVETKDGAKATSWRLGMGTDWTVPAVEFSRGNPSSTSILLADEGRKSLSKWVADLVADGRRVVVIEPFYVGEAKPAERDYLWALLLATVGDRPIGLQAGEIAAVARWLRSDRGFGAVSLVASGPRTTTASLIAAALETSAIDRLELRDSLKSLKDLIKTKASFEKSPELFCLGLLEVADVPDLIKLAAPREVRLISGK